MTKQNRRTKRWNNSELAHEVLPEAQPQAAVCPGRQRFAGGLALESLHSCGGSTWQYPFTGSEQEQWQLEQCLHQSSGMQKRRIRVLQLFWESVVSLHILELTQSNYFLADQETKSTLNLCFYFISRGQHTSEAVQKLCSALLKCLFNYH